MKNELTEYARIWAVKLEESEDKDKNFLRAYVSLISGILDAEERYINLKFFDYVENVAKELDDIERLSILCQSLELCYKEPFSNKAYAEESKKGSS